VTELRSEATRSKNRNISATIAADVRRFAYQINTDEVFGTHSDLEAKHQQFAMDPGCSPLPVFAAHPSDQVTQAPEDQFGVVGFPATRS
jgi:hypothetical protein